MKQILLTIILLAPAVAVAGPVVWKLNGVTLEEIDVYTLDVNYRALTGRFTYDADTNTYSDIDILSEPGYYLWFGHNYSENAATWWSAPVEAATSTNLVLNARTSCPTFGYCETKLKLNYAQPLTTAGGTIGLSGQEEYHEETFGVGDTRYIITGNLISVPPPREVLLDFEEFDVGEQLCPFVSKGFDINGGFTGAVCGHISDTRGDNDLWTYSSGYYEESWTFQTITGDTFNLVSFEQIGVALSVTGHFPDGSTIQTTTTGGEWTTYSFDAAWQGLVRLDIDSPAEPFGSAVDNIVLALPILPVAVDADPWADANTVKPDSNDLIPATVMGSSVASGDAIDFDVTEIDPASLKFGPGEAANVTVAPLYGDYDSDGNTDATFGFRTQDTGILCEDTEVTLAGEITNGELFKGTSAIETIECETSGCHP